MEYLSYPIVQRTVMYSSDIHFRKSADRYYELKGRRDALEISIASLDRQMRMFDMGIKNESEVGHMSQGQIGSAEDVQHQVFGDVAGDSPDMTMVGTSPDLQVFSDSKVGLKKFFERPILITSIPIAIDQRNFYTFDLWSLYTSDPIVRSKLLKYAYMRAKRINFRITISGSPFHYGRIIASYFPAFYANEPLQYYLDPAHGNIPADTRYYNSFNRYLSQQKGCKIMDISDNRPNDFSFPYISPTPAIRLYNRTSTAIAANQIYESTKNLGTLILGTLNQPKCIATGTPTSITVNLYVWLSDVELGCPSGTQLQITTQSKAVHLESDERKVGPIEKWTSAAADFTSKLVAAPVIGAYAKASTMVLSGLSSLSALFGWSYPVVHVNPIRVKNEPFQSGANFIGMDTGKRVTMDPKQELTVDPTVFGTTEDEMSLAYLSGIETWMDVFQWNPSTTALAAPIWQTKVAPNSIYCDYYVGLIDTDYAVQPTALGFAATPFAYWRGKLKYRVEVVCSKFHRGKLLVYYEPNTQQNSIINASLQINEQYMQVVDIQETQSFEFCVDWASTRPWLKTPPGNFIMKSTGLQYTPNSDDYLYYNGYVAITPFTQLQSPDDSPVFINVYVSAEEIIFNQLTDIHLPAHVDFAPTRSREAKLESLENHSSTPSVTCLTLNETGASDAHVCEEFFGERPLSFRAALKRFTTSLFFTLTSFDFTKYYRINAPIYPQVAPTYAGVSSDSSNTTLLNYLRYAFLGMRGGVRKRVFPLGLLNTNDFVNNVDVSLSPPDESPPYFAANYVQPTFIGASLNGTVTHIPHTNAGLEFELPFYSDNQFVWSFNSNPYANVDPTQFVSAGTATYYVSGTPSSYGSDPVDDPSFEERTATAEDFTLGWFSGAYPYRITLPS